MKMEHSFIKYSSFMLYSFYLLNDDNKNLFMDEVQLRLEVILYFYLERIHNLFFIEMFFFFLFYWDFFYIRISVCH